MFHVKHEGWSALQELEIPLGRDVLARLERFERALVEEAVPMGAVAPSDASRIRERHILDSLRALPLLPPAGIVCDLGSGAGLPGLVLAIARTDLSFVLVEVRRNRAAFLERATGDLPNVRIYGRRLETLRERVSVCTARAFAPPTRSWEAAERLLEPQGRLIYWAGATFDVGTDVPEGASARLFPTPALARSGPLVIMTRQ